jgi:hypothetical protein
VTVPLVCPVITIEPSPEAELAIVKLPAVVPATPRVGVAVQDDAVVLVALEIVPAAALVAFVPPNAIVIVGRLPTGKVPETILEPPARLIAPYAGSDEEPCEISGTPLVALGANPSIADALVQIATWWAAGVPLLDTFPPPLGHAPNAGVTVA